MNEKIKLLCELIIEYESNQNAAGEYDGNDPRFDFMTTGSIGAEDIIKLAKEVLKDVVESGQPTKID